MHSKNTCFGVLFVRSFPSSDVYFKRLRFLTSRGQVGLTLQSHFRLSDQEKTMRNRRCSPVFTCFSPVFCLFSLDFLAQTTSLLLLPGHEQSRLRELEREGLRLRPLPRPSDGALRRAALAALAQELTQAAQQPLGMVCRCCLRPFHRPMSMGFRWKSHDLGAYFYMTIYGI